MKRTNSFLLVIISTSWLHAGQFINLDFESPKLPLPAGVGTFASDALPGWAISATSLGANIVGLNARPLAGTAISLYGPLTGQPNPDRNLYSVRLYTGYSFLGVVSGVSMSQEGLIPDNAKSLRLDAKIVGDYHITLDGFPIAMTLVLGRADYDVYYGDISSFSGRTANLMIETGLTTDLSNLPRMYIEKISFSTLVVPEPSTYALLALGLFGLGWRARHSRAR